MQVMIEKLIRLGDKQTSCPCGCGFTNTDKRLIRLRILHDPEERIGDQFEVAISVNDGANWHGDTWYPLDNPDTENVIRRYETVDRQVNHEGVK